MLLRFVYFFTEKIRNCGFHVLLRDKSASSLVLFRLFSSIDLENQTRENHILNNPICFILFKVCFFMQFCLWFFLKQPFLVFSGYHTACFGCILGFSPIKVAVN